MPYPPIGPEDLARLHELGAAEFSLRQQLYDLELAKIPILAAGKRIREEQDSVYRRIGAERGLAPENVMINMKTGEVRVSSDQETAPPADETSAPE